MAAAFGLAPVWCQFVGNNHGVKYHPVSGYWMTYLYRWKIPLTEDH